MGILDSGSAAPTYVEPGEDRRQAGLFGLKMSEPFQHSFLLSQRIGEQRRQFDLEAPLRRAQASSMMANVDLAKARLESVQIENSAAIAQRENNLQLQSGIAGALQFESSLGGDYSPGNKARAMDYFSKNPKLAYGPDGAPTPFFKNLMGNFDTSEKLRARAELEAEKQRLMQERATRIAEIQAEARKSIEDAKAQAMADRMKDREAMSEESRRDRFISDMIEKSGATPEEAAYKWNVSQEASKAQTIEAPTEAAAINAASEWADIKENRNKKVLISYKAPSADGKTMEQKTRLIMPEPMSLRKAAEAKRAADAAKKAAEIEAIKEQRRKAAAEESIKRAKAAVEARSGVRSDFGGSFLK